MRQSKTFNDNKSPQQSQKTNLIFDSKIKFYQNKIGYQNQAYQLKSFNDEFSPIGKSPVINRYNNEESPIQWHDQNTNNYMQNISNDKVLKLMQQKQNVARIFPFTSIGLLQIKDFPGNSRNQSPGSNNTNTNNQKNIKYVNATLIGPAHVLTLASYVRNVDLSNMRFSIYTHQNDDKFVYSTQSMQPQQKRKSQNDTNQKSKTNNRQRSNNSVKSFIEQQNQQYSQEKKQISENQNSKYEIQSKIKAVYYNKLYNSQSIRSGSNISIDSDYAVLVLEKMITLQTGYLGIMTNRQEYIYDQLMSYDTSDFHNQQGILVGGYGPVEQEQKQQNSDQKKQSFSSPTKQKQTSQAIHQFKSQMHLIREIRVNYLKTQNIDKYYTHIDKIKGKNLQEENNIISIYDGSPAIIKDPYFGYCVIGIYRTSSKKINGNSFYIDQKACMLNLQKLYHIQQWMKLIEINRQQLMIPFGQNLKISYQENTEDQKKKKKFGILHYLSQKCHVKKINEIIRINHRYMLSVSDDKNVKIWEYNLLKKQQNQQEEDIDYDEDFKLIKQESFIKEIKNCLIIDNNFLYFYTDTQIYLFNLSKFLIPSFNFVKQQEQQQNQDMNEDLEDFSQDQVLEDDNQDSILNNLENNDDKYLQIIYESDTTITSLFAINPYTISYGNQRGDIFILRILENGQLTLQNKILNSQSTKNGHQGQILCGCKISDSMFCTGGSDGYIKLWDIKTCKMLKQIKETKDQQLNITHITFEKFSSLLIFLQSDNSITYWNILHNKMIKKIIMKNSIDSFNLLNQNQLLFSSSKNLYLQSLKSFTTTKLMPYNQQNIIENELNIEQHKENIACICLLGYTQTQQDPEILQSPEKSKFQQQNYFQFNTDEDIKKVKDSFQGQPVFVTGDEEGRILLWNSKEIQNNKPQQQQNKQQQDTLSIQSRQQQQQQNFYDTNELSKISKLDSISEQNSNFNDLQRQSSQQKNSTEQMPQISIVQKKQSSKKIIPQLALDISNNQHIAEDELLLNSQDNLKVISQQDISILQNSKTDINMPSQSSLKDIEKQQQFDVKTEQKQYNNFLHPNQNQFIRQSKSLMTTPGKQQQKQQNNSQNQQQQIINPHKKSSSLVPKSTDLPKQVEYFDREFNQYLENISDFKQETKHYTSSNNLLQRSPEFKHQQEKQEQQEVNNKITPSNIHNNDSIFNLINHDQQQLQQNVNNPKNSEQYIIDQQSTQDNQNQQSELNTLLNISIPNDAQNNNNNNSGGKNNLNINLNKINQQQSYSAQQSLTGLPPSSTQDNLQSQRQNLEHFKQILFNQNHQIQVQSMQIQQYQQQIQNMKDNQQLQIQNEVSRQILENNQKYQQNYQDQLDQQSQQLQQSHQQEKNKLLLKIQELEDMHIKQQKQSNQDNTENEVQLYNEIKSLKHRLEIQEKEQKQKHIKIVKEKDKEIDKLQDYFDKEIQLLRNHYEQALSQMNSKYQSQNETMNEQNIQKLQQVNKEHQKGIQLKDQNFEEQRLLIETQFQQKINIQSEEFREKLVKNQEEFQKKIQENIQQFQNKIDFLEQDKQNLRQDNLDQQNQIQKLQLQIQEKNFNLQALQKQIQNVIKSEAEINTKYQELQLKANIYQGMKQRQQDIDEITLKEVNKTLQQQSDQILMLKTQISSEQNKLNYENKYLKDKKDQMEKDLLKKNTQLKKLENRIDTLEKQLQQSEQKLSLQSQQQQQYQSNTPSTHLFQQQQFQQNDNLQNSLRNPYSQSAQKQLPPPLLNNYNHNLSFSPNKPIMTQNQQQFQPINLQYSDPIIQQQQQQQQQYPQQISQTIDHPSHQINTINNNVNRANTCRSQIHSSIPQQQQQQKQQQQLQQQVQQDNICQTCISQKQQQQQLSRCDSCGCNINKNIKKQISNPKITQKNNEERLNSLESESIHLLIKPKNNNKTPNKKPLKKPQKPSQSLTKDRSISPHLYQNKKDCGCTRCEARQLQFQMKIQPEKSREKLIQLQNNQNNNNKLSPQKISLPAKKIQKKNTKQKRHKSKSISKTEKKPKYQKYALYLENNPSKSHQKPCENCNFYDDIPLQQSQQQQQQYQKQQFIQSMPLQQLQQNNNNNVFNNENLQTIQRQNRSVTQQDFYQDQNQYNNNNNKLIDKEYSKFNEKIQQQQQKKQQIILEPYIESDSYNEESSILSNQGAEKNDQQKQNSKNKFDKLSKQYTETNTLFNSEQQTLREKFNKLSELQQIVQQQSKKMEIQSLVQNKQKEILKNSHQKQHQLIQSNKQTIYFDDDEEDQDQDNNLYGDNGDNNNSDQDLSKLLFEPQDIQISSLSQPQSTIQNNNNFDQNNNNKYQQGEWIQQSSAKKQDNENDDINKYLYSENNNKNNCELIYSQDNYNINNNVYDYIETSNFGNQNTVYQDKNNNNKYDEIFQQQFKDTNLSSFQQKQQKINPKNQIKSMGEQLSQLNDSGLSSQIILQNNWQQQQQQQKNETFNLQQAQQFSLKNSVQDKEQQYQYQQQEFINKQIKKNNQTNRIYYDSNNISGFLDDSQQQIESQDYDDHSQPKSCKSLQTILNQQQELINADLLHQKMYNNNSKKSSK